MKPSEQPPPCLRNDRDLWFGGRDIRKPDMVGIENAQMLCHNECPLSRFEDCARQALRGRLDGGRGVEGVWAGVYLPSPTNLRKRPVREAGIARLRRIAAHDVSGAA
jgi:hypothetical protein